MGADNLGTLSVQIVGDYSTLQDAISQSVQIAESGTASIAAAFNVPDIGSSMTASVDQASQAFDTASTSAEGLSSAISSIGVAAPVAGAGIEGAGSSAVKAGESAEASGIQWGELGEQLLKIGKVVGIGLGLTELGEEALGAAAQVQDLTTSLTLITKSSTQAAEDVDTLKAMALSLSEPFSSVAAQAQKMTAQFQDFGIATAAVTLAADASHYMGTSFDGAAQSIDRMVLSGTAGNRQLSTLGTSAQALGDAMGVTAAQVTTAFKALDESDRLVALQAAMSAVAGASSAFAGNMAESWTNFKTTFEYDLEEAGNAAAPFLTQVEGSLKDLLSAINPVAEALAGLVSNALIDNMAALTGVLAGLKNQLTEFSGAFPSINSAFSTFSGFIEKITGSSLSAWLKQVATDAVGFVTGLGPINSAMTYIAASMELASGRASTWQGAVLAVTQSVNSMLPPTKAAADETSNLGDSQNKVADSSTKAAAAISAQGKAAIQAALDAKNHVTMIDLENDANIKFFNQTEAALAKLPADTEDALNAMVQGFNLTAMKQKLVDLVQALKDTKDGTKENVQAMVDALQDGIDRMTGFATSGATVLGKLITDQTKATASFNETKIALDAISNSFQTGTPLANGYVATANDVARAVDAYNKSFKDANPALASAATGIQAVNTGSAALGTTLVNVDQYLAKAAQAAGTLGTALPAVGTGFTTIQTGVNAAGQALINVDQYLANASGATGQAALALTQFNTAARAVGQGLVDLPPFISATIPPATNMAGVISDVAEAARKQILQMQGLLPLVQQLPQVLTPATSAIKAHGDAAGDAAPKIDGFVSATDAMLAAAAKLPASAAAGTSAIRAQTQATTDAGSQFVTTAANLSHLSGVQQQAGAMIVTTNTAIQAQIQATTDAGAQYITTAANLQNLNGVTQQAGSLVVTLSDDMISAESAAQSYADSVNQAAQALDAFTKASTAAGNSAWGGGGGGGAGGGVTDALQMFENAASTIANPLASGNNAANASNLDPYAAAAGLVGEGNEGFQSIAQFNAEIARTGFQMNELGQLVYTASGAVKAATTATTANTTATQAATPVTNTATSALASLGTATSATVSAMSGYISQLEGFGLTSQGAMQELQYLQKEATDTGKSLADLVAAASGQNGTTPNMIALSTSASAAANSASGTSSALNGLTTAVSNATVASTTNVTAMTGLATSTDQMATAFSALSPMFDAVASSGAKLGDVFVTAGTQMQQVVNVLQSGTTPGGVFETSNQQPVSVTPPSPAPYTPGSAGQTNPGSWVNGAWIPSGPGLSTPPANPYNTVLNFNVTGNFGTTQQAQALFSQFVGYLRNNANLKL